MKQSRDSHVFLHLFGIFQFDAQQAAAEIKGRQERQRAAVLQEQRHPLPAADAVFPSALPVKEAAFALTCCRANALLSPSSLCRFAFKKYL